LFAAVRSVINTGKRQGLSAFESILVALNPLESLFSLSWAVTNLISNAIRYTPDGGVIIISSEADHKHLWVSVQDTGVGMTEEELSHVFDRFWRSAYAKTIANDGSGLGLAIAKRLVEMQSGQIHAHSEPNQGSTFCFSLPLV
jgi:signal transduction histidine kinase